jgi:type IV pilus assembly protein PilX
LQGGGADAGVTVNPGGAMTVTTTSARDTYYRLPRFYIADMGLSADATGEIYQITAAGWGGSPSAVAVVQSTYSVKTGVIDRGGP